MISKDELLKLLNCTETYRVEKTISTTNMDKFCEAICAFANDMPNSGKCGYLLIGVNDDGSRNKLHVDDELLKKITVFEVKINSVEANETLSLTNLIKALYYPNKTKDFNNLFRWFSDESSNTGDSSPLTITNLITNSTKTIEILNNLQHKESLSGKELLESVGLSVQSYNRKRFISPLLDTGVIVGIGAKTKVRYSLTILGYLYLRYISERIDK